MTTVARRDGNGFVLDGAKCMVALAAASEHTPGMGGERQLRPASTDFCSRATRRG